MKKQINVMYFSPTGTTKKVVLEIAGKISEKNKENTYRIIDFTLPAIRKNQVFFTKEDIVVVGVPVYAGRVPNVLLKYLNSISGNKALCVAVVLYGNRNYDDALIELKDILVSRGFIVIGAGAFIGEHSFSKTLGQNRPDDSDMLIVQNFSDQIYNKISNKDNFDSIEVKGMRPYRPYYVVKNENNEPVYDFRKITPKTNENCTDCKLCVDICPMGSIDFDDVSLITGICIKCCSCIKNCPFGAKYFDDSDFLMHKQDLEQRYMQRKEPEFFI
ncbi:MAG: EFR1 family ferrodoxin [Desulforegulaceae bacterium]|nr:EFR1 family ferrodoxin [Desulforegulaceae bacterium]